MASEVIRGVVADDAAAEIPPDHIINFAISFGIITLIFALMFKVLPDLKIAWRDVWIGALLTSALFNLGQFLLGLYLGKGSVSSAYGAAGSLVVVLVWVYYSAQILFFGAKFTQIHAEKCGSHLQPVAGAQVITQKEDPSAPHGGRTQAA